jgi:hypothetical protein
MGKQTIKSKSKQKKEAYSSGEDFHADDIAMGEPVKKAEKFYKNPFGGKLAIGSKKLK